MTVRVDKMAPAMVLALDASFGGVEPWRAAFSALGDTHAGGWALLAFDARAGKLVNRWTTDAAETATALLALDLTARTHPAEDFFERIDWAAVYASYQHAVHAASEPFGADADEIGAALLFDTRRAAIFEQAQTHLPGACWRDPAKVGEWGPTLPARHDVVVYCVYGHEVGRATALRLRALGLRARYLRGGIDGWQAAGRPLERKGGSA